ncbi:MAG: hypothetical protein ACOYT9_04535 [Patescibacteria group bacterium]|jgi:hypothetical protein
MKFKLYPERKIRHLLSMPFIYGMILPALVLDLTLEVYHTICFPLYGIAYVKRKNYIRIDRQKLEYLTFMEKLNCMYCGYVNGLFAYAVQVAAETEKYWCSIKHKSDASFKAPTHHESFLEYGDKKAYQEITAEKE